MPNGIIAEAGLGRPECGGDPAEGVVPARRTQRLAAGVAYEWRGETVRMVQQLGGRPALRAQAAAVGGEVRLRGQGDGETCCAPVCLQRDPALQ